MKGRDTRTRAELRARRIAQKLSGLCETCRAPVEFSRWCPEHLAAYNAKRRARAFVMRAVYSARRAAKRAARRLP